MNNYGDMAFDEFLQTNVGVGLFQSAANVTNFDPAVSRGELPVNPDLPESIDDEEFVSPGESGQRSECRSSVRKQQCNNCAAQAAVSSIEYCLCMAGDADLTPRQVDTMSEI